jgi:hypothetical protein
VDAQGLDSELRDHGVSLRRREGGEIAGVRLDRRRSQTPLDGEVAQEGVDRGIEARVAA